MSGKAVKEGKDEDWVQELDLDMDMDLEGFDGDLGDLVDDDELEAQIARELEDL